jgi:hypothetical protein
MGGKGINSFTPVIKLRLSLGRFSWNSRLFCGVARIFGPICKVYWSALSFLHMRYMIYLYKIVLNKLALLINKLLKFFFLSCLSSREYPLTGPKDWCKNNNCCVGIMGPLYLWNPMLFVPSFCGSYSHALFRLLWITPTPNAVDIRQMV